MLISSECQHNLSSIICLCPWRAWGGKLMCSWGLVAGAGPGECRMCPCPAQEGSSLSPGPWLGVPQKWWLSAAAAKSGEISQGWQEAVQCCRGWTLQFLQLNAEHFNLSSAECVHPADGPGPVFDPRLTAGMSPALCSQGMLLSVCSGRGRCSSGCFSCSVPQLRLCSELWAVTWSCVTRIGCSQPATLTDHSQLLV